MDIHVRLLYVEILPDVCKRVAKMDRMSLRPEVEGCTLKTVNTGKCSLIPFSDTVGGKNTASGLAAVDDAFALCLQMKRRISHDE